MIASGVIEFEKADSNTTTVVVGHSFREKFLPFLKKKDTEFTVEIDARCTIVETQVGGRLTLLFQDSPTIFMKPYEPIASRGHINTLRGIERFIAYAIAGEKPSDDMVDDVHEAIVESVMPEIVNRYNGKKYHKRTSEGSSKEIARCVEQALNWLATCDIPDAVVCAMGKSMKALWLEWYTWRYNEETDPLYDDEQQMDWEKYCEFHPVCELCAIAGTDGDPLERMHIVSKGAEARAYEYPWNWLRVHNSHHVPVQHQHGWKATESEFPHIVGKLKRARIMAQKMEG